MIKPEKVIIHHSASTDGRTADWGGLRRYHTQVRGWTDIAYHYGIELVGYDYEILVGRPETKSGAHCPGQNHQSIGVCLVGNFEKIPVPRGQWQTALRLVKDIMDRYGLLAEWVYPHSHFKNTKCPGKHFDIKKFRADL